MGGRERVAPRVVVSDDDRVALRPDHVLALGHTRRGFRARDQIDVAAAQVERVRRARDALAGRQVATAGRLAAIDENRRRAQVLLHLQLVEVLAGAVDVERRAGGLSCGDERDCEE